MLTRNIYLVKMHHRATSSVICGDEFATLLRRHGIRATAITIQSLRRDFQHDNESIFVLLKPFRSQMEGIKNRRLMAMLIDLPDYRTILGLPFTHIICNSAEHRDELHKATEGKYSCHYVYHNVSPKFRVGCHNKESFKLRYFGNRIHINGLPPDVSRILNPYVSTGLFSPRKMRMAKVSMPYGGELQYANMHINVRNAPFSTTQKITQAGYCGANILANLTAGGVRELLGDDYPYLCEINADSINATINKARLTFGSDIWHEGLERVQQSLQKTSDKAIVQQFREIVESVPPLPLM